MSAQTTEASSPDVPIQVGPAFATWAIGWGVGAVVAAPLAVALVGASLGDDLSVPQLTVVSICVWLPMVLVLVGASRRFGTGQPLADYAGSFRPIDLVGVPIGIATQLLMLPVLYAPLRGVWPDTFSNQRIEERAQELADRAGGWNTVLLVLVVAVAAPVIEEFVYRGLLQRSTSSAVGSTLGLLGTSVWFALVHFEPVEYPGLFVAGLVFGASVVITGRIGPAIVTHAAFNATGLIGVLESAG